ncbi:MAG: GTPase Era [Ruminococcus sp.]|uniref:GTPase Era n=1 Tax=Ruminococcus sp. TaxID=41978 RepID=UPI001B5B8E5A|nr:GTPase Era [Ruminococcus sp.]MBO4493136.1 GTPase Era [Ruminococcus sp.]MBP5430897.1 GTPase Era [Ruminococcus sp.]
MPRTAFVTIAGRTNAGKSSLLNAIVGEKIASVSSKPQTTRTRITGIRNIDDVQLVFFDTPGLHKPLNKLSEHMINTVKESVSDIDAVLFVMDCTKKINQQELELLRSMNSSKMPVILVLNKIDLLRNKDELAPIIAELTSMIQFQAVVPVSVTENSGVDIVINEIIALSEDSVHFFPEDMITDQPEKVLAAEMIREKLLTLLSDEVPHGIAVGVEQMSERDDKDILDISAVIYCEKESHKGIIIGKGGAMLKKASTAARIELEDFFQIKVNLKCWVKVKEDWRNRENLIRSFGLSEK